MDHVYIYIYIYTYIYIYMVGTSNLFKFDFFPILKIGRQLVISRTISDDNQQRRKS